MICLYIYMPIISGHMIVLVILMPLTVCFWPWEAVFRVSGTWVCPMNQESPKFIAEVAHLLDNGVKFLVFGQKAWLVVVQCHLGDVWSFLGTGYAFGGWRTHRFLWCLWAIPLSRVAQPFPSMIGWLLAITGCWSYAQHVEFKLGGNSAALMAIHIPNFPSKKMTNRWGTMICAFSFEADA